MNWAWYLGIFVGTLIANIGIDVAKYLIKKHKEKKGE